MEALNERLDEITTEQEIIQTITATLANLAPHENEEIQKIIDTMVSQRVLRAVVYFYGEGDEGSTQWCKYNNDIYTQENYPGLPHLMWEAINDEGVWEETETRDIDNAIENYVFYHTSFDWNGDAEQGWAIFDITHEPIGYYELQVQESHWEDSDTGNIH